MKKTMLTLLLAAISTGAMADWVQIASNDATDYYADPSTIRKKGDKVMMWNMYDLKKPQVSGGQLYLSVKFKMEFDCAGEQNRILSYVFYTWAMGGGEVLSTNSDPGNWDPVVPGSIGESQWRYACRKK